MSSASIVKTELLNITVKDLRIIYTRLDGKNINDYGTKELLVDQIITLMIKKNITSYKNYEPTDGYLDLRKKTVIDLTIIHKSLGFKGASKKSKNQIINDILHCENYEQKPKQLLNEIKDTKPKATTYKFSNEFIISDTDFKYEHIIHLADLHIRYATNFNRYDEYYDVFTNLINQIKEYKTNKLKCIIVICGDIFHYKTIQKSDSIALWNYLLYNITDLYPTIVITGNHDWNMLSNDIDWITSTYKCNNFYHLNQNGFYKFDNLIFGISALKDSEILTMTKTEFKTNEQCLHNKNNIYIQLYHGALDGSKLFNENAIESHVNISSFGEFDYFLLGDIHKYQLIKPNVAYSGSLIQQDMGESLFNHGFIMWNLNTNNSLFVEVQNNYAWLKVFVNENTYKYDKSIIGVKKFIYATFIMDSKNENAVEDFKNEIKQYKMSLLGERIKVKYNTISKNILEKIKEPENYIENILKNGKFDCDDENIINLHNEISQKIDIEDVIVGNWSLDWIEFKNIFCYGNNEINKIVFDSTGFYKIIADNFMGKTSIMNIIKWGIYGKESSINDRDLLYSSDSSITEGYIKFSINNSIVVKKTLETSNKYVDGVKITWELNNLSENKITVGKENVNDILNNIVGTYDEFRLISNINNEDLGILVNNSYQIFHKLYKLDRFDKYLEEVKTRIKTLKNDQTVISFKLSQHHLDYDAEINNKKAKKQQLTDTLENLKTKILKPADLSFYTSKDLKILDETIIEKPVYDINYKPVFKKEEINANINITLLPEYEDVKDLKDLSGEINELTRSEDYPNSKDLPGIVLKLQKLSKFTMLEENDKYKDRSEEIKLLEKYDTDKNLHLKIKPIVKVKPRDLKLSEIQLQNYNDDEKIKLEKHLRTLKKYTICKTIKYNDIVLELKEAKINLKHIGESIEYNKNQLDNERYIELSKQIKDVKYTKEELREFILAQGFSYEELKLNILKKLNNNTLKTEDYESIKTLISSTNYEDMLLSLETNEKLLKEIETIKLKNKEIETQIKYLKQNYKNLESQIKTNEELIAKINYNSKIDIEIADLNKKLEHLDLCKLELEYINILKSNAENDLYNKKIYNWIENLEKLKTLKSETELYFKYKNNKETNVKNKSISENAFKKLQIIKKVEKLKQLQDMYLLSIKNKKINQTLKKNKDIALVDMEYYKNLEMQEKYDLYIYNKEQNNVRKSLLLEYNKLLEENIKIESQNEVILEKIKTIENELEMINSSDIENKYLEFKNLKIEEDRILTSLNDLKIYKNIISTNIIVNYILSENLKNLEININKILKQYGLNFTIQIEHSNKNVKIYQIKDVKKISIKSVSGYETILLDIACKISLKQHINIFQSNILMIDEVMARVSTSNYSTLDNIFNMLRSNYKHILLITHIPEITNLLEYENNISIVKKKNYSVIKK